VSLAVMRRIGAALGWPLWKRAALGLGIRAIYVVERLWTWRRLVRIEAPERPGALASGPSRSQRAGLAG